MVMQKHRYILKILDDLIAMEKNVYKMSKKFLKFQAFRIQE